MKHLVFLALALSIASLIFALQPSQANVGAGFEDAYSYDAYDATDADSVVLARGNSGVLGQIIVASSSAQAVSIYDNDTATTTGATLITTLDASFAEGSYEFDLVVVEGIVLSFPAGYDGNLVVTHR